MTQAQEISGHTLTALGFEPGPWFPQALQALRAHVANSEAGALDEATIRAIVTPIAPEIRPKVALQEPSFVSYLRADGSGLDELNVRAVEATMTEVTKTPTVREAYVMPDACPAGPVGTIPVGGVVAAENAIHPGMHSADICCSVMLTDMGTADPAKVMDAIHEVTHFGPGGRNRETEFPWPDQFRKAFADNRFLSNGKLTQAARSHLGTQGDGNHFAFVGRSRKTGNTCLVTHHGSRGAGANLYAQGMKVAEKFRAAMSPETLRQNAWIPFDSPEGEDYWAALQIIRDWTKANHGVLHDAALGLLGIDGEDRFWNEHNFVFKEGDLFWHAKGATPVARHLLPDTDGRMLVPLNMAEPVLVIRQEGGKAPSKWAPHGAGRNFSRTQHRRQVNGTDAEIFARETKGLDVRFFSGNIDVTELPSAYKDARFVAQEIEHHKLATIADHIDPYGSIMAGDWEKDAPWRKKKWKKRAKA
ncbi:MAG: RtcB family protein [Pseudomonadota bacterium]